MQNLKRHSLTLKKLGKTRQHPLESEGAIRVRRDEESHRQRIGGVYEPESAAAG